MKIVLLPVGNDNKGTLEGAEAEAKHSLTTDCIEKEAGSTITPAEDTCYMLHFDTQVWQTLYKIDARAVSHVAIFTAHMPTEFERDAHYLKDDHGDDIEPTHEIPEAEAAVKEKEWGPAIGAAIIVMLCTLIGVVFIAPIFANFAKNHVDLMGCLCNSFAAGALLAAAFYLMLYESTHLIPMDDGESFAAARWGSMILTGMITASLFDLVGSAIIGAKSEKSPARTEKSPARTEPEKGADEPIADEPIIEIAPLSRRVRVLSGVLLGDFMHNLVDGLFMGAAFAQCDLTVAWTISAATIYHELAQEISDYLVLTDPMQGALKPPVALLLNFLSGFSVLLGVIIMMSTDASNYAQGMLLAFGGGVYVQIAAAECLPRVYASATTTVLRLGGLAFFTFGALAIGLVLLDHEHCSGGGDAHAGHDHGR